MKFLKKLKSGNFWVSLISAGVLIAEGIFDFEIKTEYLNQILLGLMGLMTLFGIVSDHGSGESVLLQTNSSSTATKESESTTSNAGISNIKSICDTISLLLNKVSFSHEVSEQEETKAEASQTNETLKEEELEDKELSKAENAITEIVEEKAEEEQTDLNNEKSQNIEIDATSENEETQTVIQSIVN